MPEIPTTLNIRIVSAFNIQVLSVSGNAPNADTNVVHDTYRNESGQEWRFVPLADADAGLFQIVALCSGKVLTAADDPAVDPNIYQRDWANLATQKWQLVSQEGDVAKMRLRDSNLFLTATTFNAAGPVIQAVEDASVLPGQRWLFVAEYVS